jgi:hypothetical protein
MRIVRIIYLRLRMYSILDWAWRGSRAEACQPNQALRIVDSIKGPSPAIGHCFRGATDHALCDRGIGRAPRPCYALFFPSFQGSSFFLLPSRISPSRVLLPSSFLPAFPELDHLSISYSQNHGHMLYVLVCINQASKTNISGARSKRLRDH